MSCITEILKVKGDKDFLPVVRGGYNSEIVIEGGGNYKGYEYLITFSDTGFRCGYVAISEDHPTYNSTEAYPSDYSVHGGITFFEESHLAEAILGHSCIDKWLGFDAGHAWDIHDLDAALKYFPDMRPAKRQHIEEMAKISAMDQGFRAELRTKDYMEQECKNLIDQLIEAKEAA